MAMVPRRQYATSQPDEASRKWLPGRADYPSPNFADHCKGREQGGESAGMKRRRTGEGPGDSPTMSIAPGVHLISYLLDWFPSKDLESDVGVLARNEVGRGL